MSHIVGGMLVTVTGVVLPVEVLGAHIGSTLCHDCPIILQRAIQACICGASSAFLDTTVAALPPEYLTHSIKQ